LVLEMKAPQDGDLARTEEQRPTFLAYAISYITIGIFWNNHHHTLQATERIDGRVMRANLNPLFWLSCYSLLERAIIACNGRTSRLAVAIGYDFKGWLSIGLYFVSIPLAFVSLWISIAIYIAVALIWFVPDRRGSSRPLGRDHSSK
jgi:uncharacterized membrane protein